MLITHDLGVVAEMAERVVVMYAGRKVEEAAVARDIRPPAAPLHARPARRGAASSAPRSRGRASAGSPRSRGQVPSLRAQIVGCAFAGRCPQVTDLCRAVAPAVELKSPGHLAACHYAESACPPSRRMNALRSVPPLLEVVGLKKHFAIRRGLFGGATGKVHAVDGVSFIDRAGRNAVARRRKPAAASRRWARASSA